jgi:FHA domain-containing protein
MGLRSGGLCEKIEHGRDAAGVRDDLYSAICREALESRQRDVMTFVDNGMAGLSGRLEKTLLRLPEGYYLLGLGSYNAGLVRLDYDELLIGREVPEFIGVGMPVSGFRVSSPDAFLNTEVSRLHAKLFRLLRISSDPEYRLVDMRSTCGTYLNGDPIPVPDDLAGISEQDCSRPLRSGDFFSLGPSAVNLFLFFQK